MKLRHYLLSIISLFLVGLTSANSTMMHVQPNGFDYFWVPLNLQVIHIDYPYDFVLYFFMGVGLLYCLHLALKIGIWLITGLLEMWSGKG